MQGVRTGKHPYFNAILWAELFLQKVAAELNDVIHQQILHVSLGDSDPLCVSLLDDRFHYFWRHAVDGVYDLVWAAPP